MPRPSAARGRPTASGPSGTSDPSLDHSTGQAKLGSGWSGIDAAVIGSKIDETGTLVRDAGAFVLRRDAGGRYQLELQRTPVDLIEKRVRVRGTLVGAALVSVDGVAPL